MGNIFLILILIIGLSSCSNCWVDVNETCNTNEPICLIVKDGKHLYVIGREMNFNEEELLTQKVQTEIIKSSLEYTALKISNWSKFSGISFQRTSRGIPCSLDPDWWYYDFIGEERMASVSYREYPEKIEICVLPYESQQCFKYKLTWRDNHPVILNLITNKTE